MREKIEVTAIRDNDLREVLERHALLKKLEEGKLNCNFCTQPLSWNTLGALSVKEETLILCCNQPECIDMLAARRK